MFIQVKLIHGYDQPLWYSIPDALKHNAHPGTIVRVPIRNQIKPAIIIEQHAEKPTNISFALKAIEGIDPFPADATYQNFIAQLSKYYHLDPLYFYKRIRHFLSEKEAESVTAPTCIDDTAEHVQLTEEQLKVVNCITPYIDAPAFTPTLLHGITGSGKTEVYKRLITHAIAAKKTALFLLPEVTLALQFQQLLKKQLPHVPLFGFHSGITAKEKKLLWQRLINEEPILVIGVHLPVLLPIANLGLIIVDEEHEVGYQEKKHPKINSKDAAIMRAQQAQIPILLGSATPSIASLHNVKTRNWHFFQLKERFGGALPQIALTVLTDKKQRKNFWISTRLYDEIKQRLACNEQTILFLNRRGYSFFVQCKECNFVISCTNCSVSLTLHEDQSLTCHYCSLRMQKPAHCPQCKKTDFANKGIGTQQLVSILQRLFPQARIGRADLDTTMKKNLWKKTLHDFETGALDILVGTQTITKGFHFPNVTLVGIIWGDLNFHFPMYNAAEAALQQLIQVAGRAGRSRSESLVVVQTMAEHDLLQHMHEINYVDFFDQEIAKRNEVGYPPAVRFAEIEIKSSCENTVEKESMLLTQWLGQQQASLNLPITILGPAKPPVHMIKKTHMRKIYFKCKSIDAILKLMHTINYDAYMSQIYFTPNPLH